MIKLRLDPIIDDNSVKVTIDHPGALHRDLIAYGDYLISPHVHASWTGGEVCRN